jgi:hypothetical protein
MLLRTGKRKIDTQGIFPELLYTNMQATRESGSSSLIETSSRMHNRCIKLIIGGGSAELSEKINPLFREFATPRSVATYNASSAGCYCRRWDACHVWNLLVKKASTGATKLPCAAAALKVYQNSQPEIGMIGAGDSCGTRIKPRPGIP